MSTTTTKGGDYMRNDEIRKKAKEAGIRFWEIGLRMGLNDGNFSRKLRVELSEEEKQRIFSIIEELKGGEVNAK